MESSTTKENILRKIRKALAQPVPLPFPQQDSRCAVYPDPVMTFLFYLLRNLPGCWGVSLIVPMKRILLSRYLYSGKENGKKFIERGINQSFKKAGLVQFHRKILADCDVSITGCEALVARTGSIVLSAAMPEGRTASVYAPVHICIARTSQLVYDVKDALQRLQKNIQTTFPPW